MKFTQSTVLVASLATSLVSAYPWKGSLSAREGTAGSSNIHAREYSPVSHLSAREIDDMVAAIVARGDPVGAGPVPPTQLDRFTRLVNDADHPFQAPGPNDQRGPCPGLNTLANHGWLPRNGIATPQQIQTAVQLGLNMDDVLASFLAFGAILVDGNPLTNLLSIGGKSSATGTDPAGFKALVGGLNVHGTFEGDASTTRSDAAIGDNHNFNETLFQVLVDAANTYGNGEYNLTVAAHLTKIRWQDSVANNPSFVFQQARTFTAYAEKVFPFRFFVDGRSNNGSLNLDVARGFFQRGQFPDGFYRRNGRFDIVNDVYKMTKISFLKPGHNEGVNNYIVNTTDPGLINLNPLCTIYQQIGYEYLPTFYANATGVLVKALQQNLDNFLFGGRIGSCQRIVLANSH